MRSLTPRVFKKRLLDVWNRCCWGRLVLHTNWTEYPGKVSLHHPLPTPFQCMPVCVCVVWISEHRLKPRGQRQRAQLAEAQIPECGAFWGDIREGSGSRTPDPLCSPSWMTVVRPLVASASPVPWRGPHCWDEARAPSPKPATEWTPASLAGLLTVLQLLPRSCACVSLRFSVQETQLSFTHSPAA